MPRELHQKKNFDLIWFDICGEKNMFKRKIENIIFIHLFYVLCFQRFRFFDG